jgi:ribosome-associated translation inhibitor RaiA
MDLRLFIRGVERPAELREQARERVRSGLRRFAARILSATVRLEDETGPQKSRIDKVCQIELRLRSGVIRIREVGQNFRAVIDVALDRVRGALSRQVGRAKRGVGEG